jgi:hypothetical protein
MDQAANMTNEQPAAIPPPRRPPRHAGLLTILEKMMERKFDWFIEHIFGWIVAGAFTGIVGGLVVATWPGSLSKDKLYVDCLRNMGERTIEQLEMMCSHLRKP